ncbi:putative ATP-dependent RNA helicase DHX34 [Tubulanus polymorphus]|uniref:putative ATP-dependent RNA helicase DHX34 n=1 Tax=Tubulanus polymorphus TaxID=672921 RepID=UPI003DA3222A
MKITHTIEKIHRDQEVNIKNTNTKEKKRKSIDEYAEHMTERSRHNKNQCSDSQTRYYNHKDSDQVERDNYGRCRRSDSRYAEELDEKSKKTCKKEEEQDYDNVTSKQEWKERREEHDDDYDFNFEEYRSSLAKIFFKDEDTIKRGSKEYHEFWEFLRKYQSVKRRKLLSRKDDPLTPSEPVKRTSADLPEKYKKQIETKEIQEYLKHGVYTSDNSKLEGRRVSQFKNIVMHYFFFLEKQKIAKEQKIIEAKQNLPIYQYKSDILEMVEANQVILVAGDTGCGKSTQVPQYLIEAGYDKIACTQPRRIACISLAKRVGYEMLKEETKDVGYQVRFEREKNQGTRVLFLTEGLLLRQMASDELLSIYSVIVIDEVHERHIHTDFLLGVLKCLIMHRPDLKIILMSATINIELFGSYFSNCPVVKVPGRLYPITLEYCPIASEDKAAKIDPRPYIRIMQKIDHKYPATERGDMLIFLSGMTEIMTVCETARMFAQETRRWIVLPLHSALSIAEQDKVFDIAPEGTRKCIVSTNIAETSVTIDGVRFIVDSGKVKEMSYDPKYKMQRLQEFWISRASAEQRKGRAGRTGPGVCYRLYDESDYNNFQEYTTPEIQRVPLDSVVLQVINMGLPDARKFPFIESPPASSIENSIFYLKEQGAINSNEEITPIGQLLSRLPVDVVVGKMLIMGSNFHMVEPVLRLAAALSVQSPFTSKAHTDRDAVANRKSLESEHGDPFTILNAYDEWIKIKAEGRGSKKWCSRRGFEEQRFYEMSKLRQQFKDLLKDHNLLFSEEQQQYTTSTQRKQQHADRKRLRHLKWENYRKSKKPKFLKPDQDDFVISDEEETAADNQDSDIKDLEFRLTNNLDVMQDTSFNSMNFTLRDINLLKIILCSGLYPQWAIADETNSYKKDSDQAFHTRQKGFILLHPTSIFATNPDILQPKQPEYEEMRGMTKETFSTRNELLVYVSLLETNKPYLINTMRVPALQTLLLFSASIDTNADMTRILCDGWLELKFKDSDEAQFLVSSVIQLRTTWQDLLKQRLQETIVQLDEDGDPIPPKSKKLERILATKLTEFLDSSVLYSLRRVMAAEIEHVYIGPQTESKSELPVFESNQGKCHPIKGGKQINEYLIYNCLCDNSTADIWGEYTSCLQKHWLCPYCNETMIVTVEERLAHQTECQALHPDALNEGTSREKQTAAGPLRKLYNCDTCNEQFMFTKTEILRHRKSHSSGKS